ncbi:MAG: glucose-1-phosphate adenylyltransferase [Dehalococcoidia bacterium]
MNSRVLALILAGGQGDRLSILSEERAKPAVIFAGKYRIIDFALSNCRNSGIDQVGVLTQYRPRSLNDHIGIGRPWGMDREDGGIALLQPYLGRESSDWYRGTADAVYQNLFFVEESKADTVLILSADHVYTMAYDQLIAYHNERRADVTVPVYEVPLDEASRYGLLVTDEDGRVTRFDEKPDQPQTTTASTGIYVFNRDVLVERLVHDAGRVSSHDFGRDILPEMLADYRVFGYKLKGYWRDVGTVDAYWQANMDLLVDLPELDLYNPETAIRSRLVPLPPAKIGPRAYVSRSLLTDGDIINGHVEHSVLSPGVYIEDGAIVRDSILFDDCFVERGAVIERAILDKSVHVGEGARIGASEDYTANKSRPDLLSSGITVVGKRAFIGSGTAIGRNCIIGPNVRPEDFTDAWVPSGETIRAQRMPGVPPGV